MQKTKKKMGGNMHFDQRSLIHQEEWFPPCFVGQRIPQNVRDIKI